MVNTRILQGMEQEAVRGIFPQPNDFLMVRMAPRRNAKFYTIRARTMREARKKAKSIDNLGCFLPYVLPRDLDTIPLGVNEYTPEQFDQIRGFIREHAVSYWMKVREDGRESVRLPRVCRTSGY